MPRSMAWPWLSQKSAGIATRGTGCLPVSRSAKEANCGPETRTTPMPPRPGAVATAAITSLCGLFPTLDHAGDLPLLGNRQQVVNGPIKHESGREKKKHTGKYDGHDHHDLGLHRIRWRRIEFGLNQHGGTHDQGQHIVRILY